MDYPVNDPTALLHNGKFTDGDPLIALPPSPDKAAYQNMVFDELLNVITGADLTPDAGSLQVLEAINTLIAAAVAERSNDDGIGEIRSGPFATAPTNWLFFEGDNYYSRSEYPKLWAYINSYYKVVADADRAQFPGCFTGGNGSTTFRLPTMPDLFVRGAGGVNSASVGERQGDAIRNISGRLGRTIDYPSMEDATGAFEKSGSSTSADSGAGAGYFRRVDMDASRQVPTASENRPANIAWRYIIRAK